MLTPPPSSQPPSVAHNTHTPHTFHGVGKKPGQLGQAENALIQAAVAFYIYEATQIPRPLFA
jgi:hypothetical protein